MSSTQQSLDIFQIMWQADDKEVTRVSMPAKFRPANLPGELVLRHHEQTYTLDARRRSALLGRSDTCQIGRAHV